MRKKLFFYSLIFGIILICFAAAINAEDIHDESEFKVEDNSGNYIETGEDIYYDDWVSNYKDKLINTINKLESYSDKYESNLSNWRNKKVDIPAEFKNEMKMIVGDIEGNQIHYTQNDVYNSELNLVKIKAIMEHGKVDGMFVENGELYVTADQDSKGINSLENNNLLVHNIPLLFDGIYTSSDYSIWQTFEPPRYQPDRDKYVNVLYGGSIEDTHVGSVLFEADRIMKILSSGYDNRTGERIEGEEWFKSEWDFIAEEDFDNHTYKEEWHRYWFTINKNAISVDPEANAVRIKDDILQVKTERVEMVNGQLQSSFQKSSYNSQYKWVEHFNENLDRYKEEYPVLEELEVLSRWSALLLAMRENGIVFDDVEIGNIPTQKTPTKTSVIKIIKEREVKEETMTQVRTQSIVGGVDFSQIETYITDLSDYKSRYINHYINNDVGVEKIF